MNKDEIILKRIKQAFDPDSMTTEDFVKAFEMVIEFVQKTYTVTQEEVEKLQSMFVEAVNELKVNNQEHSASTKARVMAYCEEEMKKMMASHEKMMQKCDDKLSDIKDGKDADEERVIEEVIARLDEREANEPEEPEETPREVADFLNQEAEIIEQETIIGLVKRLRELEDAIARKSTTNVIGGATGGGRLVKVHDLTDQLDGVTKTFALPAFWRVISVHSSSFPNIFRPTIDYTTDASAMTITFTDEITADATLATGQTLLVVYAEA